MYDTLPEITKEGRTFAVTVEYDDTVRSPWLEEDGHGPVSGWVCRSKQPGERVLASTGTSHLYYDFAAAIRIARTDGWDAPPFGEGTRRQRAARAVEADFQRLKGWCEDRWHYVGVVVTERCPCCNDFTGPSSSLWGIESDAGEYLDEVANILIDEIIASNPKEKAHAC